MLIQDKITSGVDANASGSEYEPTGFKTASIIENIYKEPTKIFGTLIDKLFESIGPPAIGKSVANLDKKSSELIRVLGVGSARGIELTETIADVIPKYMQLGLESSQVTKDYASIVNELNTNVKLTDDQMVSLAATAKVTGLEAGKMVKSFQDVGVPLSMIEDKMLTIVDVAKETGVILGAVAAGVNTNLGKLNTFNFEGGIKGLAKMSAQSARLGVDMGQIFTKAEDFLNPENAIEFSAALQRLGVTSSQLLDPLKVLDLSLNDPTELTNQIVKMTEEFVFFSKENNQFEILPGSKLRLREVAKELGMTAEQFAAMSTNAANFDMKLKSVQFAPNIDEKDRELVATMAQISKEGITEVKVKTLNEKTGELTGPEKMVDVTKLSDLQIEDLRRQQEIQGKSMEEIAQDQLGLLESIDAGINGLVNSITGGIASSKNVQSPFRSGVKTAKDVIGKTKNLTTETFREGTTETFNQLGIILEEVTKDLPKGITDLFSGIKDKLTKIYKDVFGTTPSSSSSSTATPLNTPNPNRTLPQTTIGGGGNQTTSTNTQPSNMNVTHTFNFSNLPSYVTSTEVERILKEYTQNSQNALAMVTAAGKVNNGLTSNK
jgi:hypothetical protein